MTSQKRIEANRRNAMRSTGPRTATGKAHSLKENAALSTGPRTAEGKARSSLNAVTHGLTARTPVLPGEDAAALQHRMDAWMADVQPGNPAEEALVREAVHLSWRLERAERVIVEHVTEQIATARDAANRHGEGGETDDAALAARLLFDDSLESEWLNRQESRFHNALLRNIERLDRARRERIPQNEPNPMPADRSHACISPEVPTPTPAAKMQNEPNPMPVHSPEVVPISTLAAKVQNEPNPMPVRSPEVVPTPGPAAKVQNEPNPTPPADPPARPAD